MKKIKSLFILLFVSQLIYAFEMIDIPEITFYRSLKNGKQQEVTVSSFYMAKDDILIEEWCKYKDASGISKEENANPSDEYINMLIDSLWESEISEIDLKWPVFNISWLEAIEFCNWLSKKENLKSCYEILTRIDGTKTVKWNKKANGYRLPTVAEWEAVSEIYTNKFSDDYMFKTNINIYNRIWYRDYRNKYEPNTYGLVNLMCDAGKFLWDYYNENYEETSIKVINPIGAEKFEKPENYKFRNELINELRICTKPCTIRSLNDYLNQDPFVFCESSDTWREYTIRLCRSKK